LDHHGRTCIRPSASLFPGTVTSGKYEDEEDRSRNQVPNGALHVEFNTIE